MIPTMAQATTEFEILKFVSGLGSSGILAFVLWYVFAKMIPRMQADAAAQQDKLITTIKEITGDFRKTVETLTQQYADDIRELRKLDSELRHNDRETANALLLRVQQKE